MEPVAVFQSFTSSSFSHRILALSLGLAFALAGCGEKPKTEGAGGRRGGGGGVPPVLVGKVRRKSVPLTLEAIGAVEPIHTAALRSQVTGTFMKIGFQEGQDVREGDLLFELDPRPFRNALNSADADAERVRAQLENARLQVSRYAALNTGSIVTKEQYQAILVAERVLSAQLAAAESAVANARLQLDYCSIRAPFGGRTGGLGAHEGDLVRASDAAVTLVTINQLSPIYVTFGVPQQYLAPLARYRAAGTIEVSAAPPDSEGAAEKGTLTFLDNAVDPATGMLKLKATFPNAAQLLWPGQFASVRVILATPEALVVPSAAVQNDQKGQHVFVVKEDRTAELRRITIERANENDTVVASGLAEGETVVTEGQLRVVSGKPVEVREPAAATADGAPKPHKKRKTE
ncbi:MAG: Efflux transporter periplasmic adaptor subunit [Lacunisphaera sp.]|nr:Efflux transporter periplasmic adaptor subunit [Lacunisphaera sp.]